MRAYMPVPAERAERYVELGYWDDRRLRDGVEAAASKRPDDLAVVDGRRGLTWSGLAGLIAGGVHRLVDRGVAPGDVVILVAGNTSEAVVAYHSLLRVGATAVLLDRRCGAADLRVALDALRASLVVSPASELARLQGELSALATLALEEFGEAFPDRPAGWAEPDRNVPAVVLFTSGTTSRPKGVTHSINTLTAGSRNMALTTDTDESSVVYLVSPLTSITGVMQAHLVADCHCTFVLDDAFEPEHSLDRIVGYGATILGGAPVIVERLVEAADRRGAESISLRTLGLGGTLLPRAFLEHVASRYGVDVVRVYGSSEAPNSTGKYPGDQTHRELVDDGALMPGTEVRVGSSEHPQEGLLRGPAVFLGYLDEAHNRESFEGEWYRSGDLVELKNDRLTVIGRLKEIVNRNGFKISLGEIDAALHDQDEAGEWASFGLPDPVTGERLAVAVFPGEEGEVSLESVIARLRAAGVATRKLPEQVVIWDGPLPRTASGKVIRSRLSMEAGSKRSFLADRLRTT